MSEDYFEKLMGMLPPEIAEAQRAKRAENQAAITKLNKQATEIFQLSDSVQGGNLTPQKLIDPNSMFVIRRMKNPKGDEVYVKTASKDRSTTFPSQNEMLILSGQIKTEKTSFDSLVPSEQARMQREGNLKFGTYLKQETLKAEFLRLK